MEDLGLRFWDVNGCVGFSACNFFVGKFTAGYYSPDCNGNPFLHGFGWGKRLQWKAGLSFGGCRIVLLPKIKKRLNKLRR